MLTCAPLMGLPVGMHVSFVWSEEQMYFPGASHVPNLALQVLPLSANVSSVWPSQSSSFPLHTSSKGKTCPWQLDHFRFWQVCLPALQMPLPFVLGVPV
jgi:hypothetical protein